MSLRKKSSRSPSRRKTLAPKKFKPKKESKAARARRLKAREIPDSLKAHLSHELATRDRVIKGSQTTVRTYKREIDSGFHEYHKESALFFERPLPLELASKGFERWAEKQIERFGDEVWRKIRMRPTVYSRSRIWLAWKDGAYRAQFDSEERERAKISKMSKSFQSIVKSYRPILKSGRKEDEAPAVAGYSLYMYTGRLDLGALKRMFAK